jgi:hypothetical protein
MDQRAGVEAVEGARRMEPGGKLVIEVVAGIVPGTPMPEYTRRWGWTSANQEALNSLKGIEAPTPEQRKIYEDARALWIRIHGESREYEASLENPARVNWVRRDWIWL